MKAIQVSDELFDRLKNCVVDPFDDTPESVISRLIEIVDKAKSKWSPLDAHVGSPLCGDPENAEQQVDSEGGRPGRSEHWQEPAEAVL